MSGVQFVAGLFRVAAIVIPAVVAARWLRLAWVGVSGAVGVVVDVVLSVSVVLVAAEVLGLVALDHPAELIVLLVLFAIACRVAVAAPEHPVRRVEPGSGGRVAGYAVLAGIVVVAQWCLQTANAWGGGMASFDTLWYHMPFAARFAQSGDVTGILFTQADPFVAYYPANSELLHGVGIAAMHGDFLSPSMNLVWLAIALLASWCIGRRWQVQPLTLTAGCVVLALPVLSGTQPGEAFNDIAGLAALLAATALLLEAREAVNPIGMLVVGGLALGLAVGTKVTFIVPALVLLAGVSWVGVGTNGSRRRRRFRASGVVAGPLVLTGGWWYLRDLVDVGNPLGLRVHVGPVALPGPASALAAASQQTVFSELRHLSLWGSRFAPGFDHALGPLWPVVLALGVGACVAGLGRTTDPTVRMIALAAALAGVSYLFLPTGATGLKQGTAVFQVNLRYATPALGLAIPLLPILVRERAPRQLSRLGWGFLILILATQFERVLWPTQTARHLAFLIAVAAAAVAIHRVRILRHRSVRVVAAATVGLALVMIAGGYIVQRHYFERRYLLGNRSDPGLGALYRWAQGVAHARIALYGTVEQYPLYGARDTNVVDYVGTHTPAGGYEAISNCRAWRTTLNRGHYSYIVLTPAPTAVIPASWTDTDPAATLVLSPAHNIDVWRVTGRFRPATCP